MVQGGGGVVAEGQGYTGIRGYKVYKPEIISNIIPKCEVFKVRFALYI